MELINFLEEDDALQSTSRLWRNQANVACFFKISRIEEDMHNEWLKSLKCITPKNIAFFIKFEGAYRGVTYFHSIDYAQKVADWGIYIHDANMRGRGLGTKALEQCLQIAQEKLHLETIFLDVLATNSIAKSVYEKTGFVLRGARDGFQRYEKKLTPFIVHGKE